MKLADWLLLIRKAYTQFLLDDFYFQILSNQKFSHIFLFHFLLDDSDRKEEIFSAKNPVLYLK